MKKLKGTLSIFLTLLLPVTLSYSQSWVQQTSGTNLNLNSVYFLNVNTGYIGANSGNILKTINGGTNWSLINSGFSFNIISVKFFDSNNGVAAGDKIIRSTNGGTSWILVLDTAFATDISYVDNNNWFFSANPPRKNKKTTNQGGIWTNLGTYDSNSTSITMPIFFIDLNTGWIARHRPAAPPNLFGLSIGRSTNSGLNWNTQYSNVFQGSVGIHDILFVNTTTGFGVLSLGSSGQSILKTTNAGLNWVFTTVGTAQKNIFFFNNSVGWTCGFSGVMMKTLDGGNSWVSEQTPVNTILNSIYFATNETGWICGANGVILKSTNGGITSLYPLNNIIPYNYSLYQNYPNPFNPITKIQFDVPRSSFVSLVVYNSLGIEVDIVVNEQVNPGTYSVDFDASAYPSGVYFYKITAGEYSETKKMILLK